MPQSIDELRIQAETAGQGHLFRFFDELDAGQRDALAADLAAVDFDLVSRLLRTPAGAETVDLDTAAIEPPPVFPAEPGNSQQAEYDRAIECGQELLSAGKVAALVVAGGQGTRLGFDAPKGTFPISPVKHKTLFQLLAESILATRRRYKCSLPWYIMTSDATDAATRQFFAEQDYFGLGAQTVQFFQQGLMPAVDDQGRILLADRHRLALSPNGHGGTLTALVRSGILAEMLQRGIEVISYFQVDNPLASPADPLFIGLHAQTRSQFSSIAVPKADDLEKVGNFVQMHGKLRIIEYSDLPDGLAHAKDAEGNRLLDAGNVAIHLLCPRFVEHLAGGGAGSGLPWHRARKKVPFLNVETGRPVEPDTPNATKFEMFIFDAIPLAERSMVLQRRRREVFSPVKNAEGVDSPATAVRDMINRAGAWLDRCGVGVPRKPDSGEPDAAIEISPLRALDVDQLRETVSPELRVSRGADTYLD